MAPLIFRWQRAVRDSEMPASRKGFALLLSTWADADGGNIFPSAETLMGLGYSRATVFRHLHDLEADGWFDVKHGGGRRCPNCYQLRIPEPETVPLVRLNRSSPETETVSREELDQPIDHPITASRDLRSLRDPGVPVSGVPDDEDFPF